MSYYQGSFRIDLKDTRPGGIDIVTDAIELRRTSAPAPSGVNFPITIYSRKRRRRTAQVHHGCGW